MTERMKNALRHIKTSVNVDPWAIEEIERVFKAIDDIKAELSDKEIFYRKQLRSDYKRYGEAFDMCLRIICKHIDERGE